MELDLEQVHAGKMGASQFCDLAHSARRAGLYIPPTHEEFSGFVFKLQANMDARHRDRIAFVRVCSGKFEKDMVVNHARLGKSVRLSHPQKLFAQRRKSLDEAYPGDGPP